MITLEQFFETIEYKISNGEPCITIHDRWPATARFLACEDNFEVSTVACVFDTVDQMVYQMYAIDYKANRAYRWTHPAWVESYKASVERSAKDGYRDEPFENSQWIDLDVASDLIEKASAIHREQPYDDRIEIPLTIEDDVLFKLMLEAHRRDITFNQLVTEAVEQAIEKYRLKGELE